MARPWFAATRWPLVASAAIACAGCAPSLEARAVRQAALTTVAAYEDAPPGQGLFARVICRGGTTTWTDIAVLGTDEDARRLCESTARVHECRDRETTARSCSEAPLGPAPEVPKTAALLRSSEEGAPLEVLLQDAEVRRRPSEARVLIRAYELVSSWPECVAQRDRLEQRSRAASEESERLRVEILETQVREARAQLASFEARYGRPVGEHMADLYARLTRARSEAERRSLQNELVEANVAELEDAHLRRMVAQDERLLAQPPRAPTEVYSCLAPGGPAGPTHAR